MAITLTRIPKLAGEFWDQLLAIFPSYILCEIPGKINFGEVGDKLFVGCQNSQIEMPILPMLLTAAGSDCWHRFK